MSPHNTIEFPIPEEALAQHTAVLGKTGSGKTSTAKLIVEHVVAEEYRVCVLDPIKSDWWGLTSSSDGKRPGLPFTILGGPRGHVELPPRAGVVLGDLVANGKLPLSIIDMANFRPGEHQAFFTEFAETLLRKARGVTYLVLEEAHFFAPKERAGITGENMAVYWAKMLATAGRSKGIRLILVTQRTQALHNALLGSCDTVIVHRLTAPADQEPVQKWLKANVSDKETVAAVSEGMSSLKTGTGWLCSGEAKVFALTKWPRIATFDNTATPDKNGDALVVNTAKVDQAKLRALLDDAIGKTAAPAAKRADNHDIEDIRRAAREEGYKVGFATGVQDGLRQASEALSALQSGAPAQIVAAPTASPKISHVRSRTDTPVKEAPSGDSWVAAAKEVYPAVLTWGQLGAMIGKKARGGHFWTMKKALLESGVVREDGDKVILRDPPELPSGARVADILSERLPEPSRKMFVALRSKPLTPEELGDMLGMQPRGGHWWTGLALLRSANLIEESGGMIMVRRELEARAR